MEKRNERRRRSALYMPASNARAVAKSRSLACDVVILDLEDAVAPEHKPAARLAARAEIDACPAGREIVVRVNAVASEHFAADVAALAGSTAPILLPKVDSVQTLEKAAAALGDRPYWAMIESCRGILDVAAIAGASAKLDLQVLVVGTNDLAKEMRCRLDNGRRPIWAALTQIVLAGRAHGLELLDSVYNDIADEEGFAAECREGADFGFGGKSLIHPRQIEICNRAFSPSETEVAWARAVVETFALPQNRDVNALAIEGRMVERLHLSGAERILERARS